MLADPFGSFMHPLSMLLSLVYGVVAGASLIQSSAFLLVGIASWWIAYNLQVTRLARIWLAIASMLGGHIVCRLELGSLGMPLSLASLWLSYAALLHYWIAPTRLRAILFGVCLGGLLTAGQVYYQYFFVLSIGILAMYGWRTGVLVHRVAMRSDLLVSIAIGLLIAAPLLLNSSMTLGIYTKESELDMKYAAPFSTQVLNFLLPKAAYARIEGLNPAPFPWAYATYIGFLPLIGTALFFRSIRNPPHRIAANIAGCAGLLAMLMATGLFSKLLIALNLSMVTTLASGFRWVAIYNGVSGLVILFLCGLGIHAFVAGHVPLPSSVTALFEKIQRYTIIDTRIVLAGVFALYNVLGLYDFASPLIRSLPVSSPTSRQVIADMATLPQGYLEMPDWMFLPAMEAGIKNPRYVSSIAVKGHSFPPANYFLTQKVPESPTTQLRAYADNWLLLRNDVPDSAYAAIQTHSGATIPCRHRGDGGDITVECEADEAGILRVHEFALDGWMVTSSDGTTSPVPIGDWLTVATPAGGTTYRFTYTPWYAWVGVWLIPTSWFVVFVLLWRAVRSPATDVAVQRVLLSE